MQNTRNKLGTEDAWWRLWNVARAFVLDPIVIPARVPEAHALLLRGIVVQNGEGRIIACPATRKQVAKTNCFGPSLVLVPDCSSLAGSPCPKVDTGSCAKHGNKEMNQTVSKNVSNVTKLDQFRGPPLAELGNIHGISGHFQERREAQHLSFNWRSLGHGTRMLVGTVHLHTNIQADPVRFQSPITAAIPTKLQELHRSKESQTINKSSNP